MIRLSYSTSGLVQLPFLDAIDAVADGGYEGIELGFHRHRFNPFELNDATLDQVGRRLHDRQLVPACVATASHFFTPSRPHEPSLLTLDTAGRKRRIDLIKRGIRVARRLGVKNVTFGSGFLRAEHRRHPEIDIRQLLVRGIRECLNELTDADDITLLIEPEPGMFIETLDQGLALIERVGSPRFRLHVDICHAFCSEIDCLDALQRAAPATRYLHVSDAETGHNLRLVTHSSRLALNGRESTLVYFPATADFLLVDRKRPLYFCDRWPGKTRQRRLHQLLAMAGIDKPLTMVDYGDLHAGSSPLDDEIFTWLISIPGLSFEVLERVRPIVAWLRGASGPMQIGRRVAHTRTGIVHYHEIPGRGCLDLAGSFETLDRAGFDGHATVELYHHLDHWQQALSASHRHLSALIPKPLAAEEACS